MGRAAGTKTNGILLFNEYIDDKRLGLWLKTALDCQEKYRSMHAVGQSRCAVVYL